MSRVIRQAESEPRNHFVKRCANHSWELVLSLYSVFCHYNEYLKISNFTEKSLTWSSVDSRINASQLSSGEYIKEIASQ